MIGLRFYLTNTVNEAIANSQFQEAMNTIQNYLKKSKIYVRKDISNLTVEGIKYYGYFAYSCQTMNGAYFLWKQGKSTELDGVMFTKDAANTLYLLTNGGKCKFDVSCNVNGTSLAQILPMVRDVIAGNIKMNEKDIRNWFKEHQLYESLKEGAGFFSVNEDNVDAIRKQRELIRDRIRNWKKKGKDTTELQAEFDEIDRRYQEAKIAVRSGVSVDVEGDRDEYRAQEEEYEQRATPEERFNDMEHYVNMVLKGLQPSVLICGAPGVGKTYRVMQKVKSSGHNYKVIKGKETALAFYMDLFHFRHEGDILICDDADDVLTDETITNLIKAATDSSDERIVSYGTSKPPIMSEEEYMSLSPEDQEICGTMMIRNGVVYTYPKSFITKGSLIIITNRNAGQIDTAVRNRGLICDLAFTVEECLGLVKNIMPAIMPNKLSVEAKLKALKYLEDLAGNKSKMEISIRSFVTVSKVFEDVDDDSQAERMIKEQMRLQALKSGRKY